MVAAGFTLGEADALRRAMAAWRRSGSLDTFREKLFSGLRERGYGEKFADQLWRQLQGFSAYGFPESHAASFAAIAYASGWLKRHSPAAFAAGLINSQPMGFYTPQQIVRGVREHGVEVRPIDAIQLLQARDRNPFSDTTDLVSRTRLARGDLELLAGANALATLAGHRHQSAWALAGVETQYELLTGAPPIEATPMLRAPSEGQNIFTLRARMQVATFQCRADDLSGSLQMQFGQPACA